MKADAVRAKEASRSKVDDEYGGWAILLLLVKRFVEEEVDAKLNGVSRSRSGKRGYCKEL